MVRSVGYSSLNLTDIVVCAERLGLVYIVQKSALMFRLGAVVGAWCVFSGPVARDVMVKIGYFQWGLRVWMFRKNDKHMVLLPASRTILRYLREALAGQGLQTLPNQRVSITSTIEYEG